MFSICIVIIKGIGGGIGIGGVIGDQWSVLVVIASGGGGGESGYVVGGAIDSHQSQQGWTDAIQLAYI